MIGVSNNEDDLEAAIGVGLGELAEITVNNDADPSNYDVSVVLRNRIYHWSPLQTEKSQLKGKWIMPEMRFIEFTASSLDPRVGISRLHRTMIDYFSYLLSIE